MEGGTLKTDSQVTISAVHGTGLQNDSTRERSTSNNFRNSRTLLRWFPRKFSQPDVEALYQNYSSQSRTGTFNIAVTLGLIINITSITSSAFFYTSRQIINLVVMGTFFIVNVALLVLLRFGKFPKLFQKLVPWILWVAMSAQLYCDVILGPVPPAPSSGIAWQACIIFR